MAGTPDPAAQVRAFIEGVMAQAQTPDAASRTRPFVVNQDRLAEAFPDEQQASVALLVDLVRDAVGDDAGSEAVYRLTFAALHDHLLRRTQPSSAEVAHLVGFALGGLGMAPAPGHRAGAKGRDRGRD